MRILVLGAGGLIGHTLLTELSRRFGDVHATLRTASDHPLLSGENVHSGIDIRNEPRLLELISDLRPEIVINCVGITKRKPAIEDLEQAIAVNALFPHRLAHWAKKDKYRVLHFSTDCVFDGAEGPYSLDSNTTGRDIYGKTKALGEIRNPHTLTIRSSFIGRELTGKSELLEWVLSMRGKSIRGFDKAWYSGVSTLEMSRVVGDVIEHHPDLGGLVQLATVNPINKYELIQLIDKAFSLELDVTRDSSLETRPTLDGSYLRETMALKLPDWPEMLAVLAAQEQHDVVCDI